MTTKFEAIRSLRPNLSFEMDGDVIKFLDGVTTVPTEKEINAEIARLQAEYDAKEYQRQRAKEYPSIEDQLDTLYHGGYDAWKAQIQEVKERFPK